MVTTKTLIGSIYLFIITAALIATVTCACSGSNSVSGRTEDAIPREALESLNATIKDAPRYLKRHEISVDSIKKTTGTSITDYWLALVKVSEHYRQTDVDSAIIYAARARELATQLPDTVSCLRGDFAFIDALSTAGVFPPALHSLDSLEHSISRTEDKVRFWQTARRCYSYITTWVDSHSYYVRTYHDRYNACDDSLLLYLPQSDRFRQFIQCERLVNEQQWSEARTRLEELITTLPQEDNLYGMAAYQLAIVHQRNGNFNAYTRYLALAAESDIKGCVREGLALPTLANHVYEHGDIDNAFRYVNYTLEDANSGNIRMRTPSIVPIIPLIDNAIHRRSAASRNQMLIYIIITTILFVATIILLIFTVSSLKKRRMSQEKLAITSKKLESYVGNFIGLCSNYAGRLDQLSRLVTRKIAAGQTDDLVKLVNSGKFGEEDNEEFYRLIDKALLDIFPDFVAQINLLLLPDQQIVIPPSQPLTPELRIYAFVRLGVDQSSRIAQILGYSVNTVYAYRNRMRNRALDRDKFDSLVMGMG